MFCFISNSENPYFHTPFVQVLRLWLQVEDNQPPIFNQTLPASRPLLNHKIKVNLTIRCYLICCNWIKAENVISYLLLLLADKLVQSLRSCASCGECSDTSACALSLPHAVPRFLSCFFCVQITRKPFLQHTASILCPVYAWLYLRIQVQKLLSQICIMSLQGVLMKWKQRLNFLIDKSGALEEIPHVLWKTLMGDRQGQSEHFQSHILKHGILRTNSVTRQSLKSPAVQILIHL